MRFNKLFSILFLLLAFPHHILANDTIAKRNRDGAGGIVFLKSENVRMVSEELEISLSSIRVHYRFLNDSDKDVPAMMAFPLPEYPWDWSAINGDMANGALRNIFTKVNGNSVATANDKRAMMNGTDITDELRGMGLSDKQIFEAIAYCEGVDFREEPVEVAVLKCGFTAQQIEAISKRNLWGWGVKETKLWKYVFPAHKEVDVVHEYSPYAGFAWGFDTSLIDKACVDKRTAQAIEKLPATDSGINRLITESVAYILRTGNNWKGPIDHFKLTIKKSSPDQVVSLCFRGRPKRVDGNIEFTEHNFVPEDDLVVYFFKNL